VYEQDSEVDEVADSGVLAFREVAVRSACADW
jgi:hypothetical protein